MDKKIEVAQDILREKPGEASCVREGMSLFRPHFILAGA